MILFIGIFFMILSLAVQFRFRSKLTKYSQEPLLAGLTGREVAEKMLRDNRITDVEIVCVQGELVDHYNPETRTVSLSPNIYHGNSVISAAVAAHEVGHAVQHATQYSMLSLRSAMVPLAKMSSTILNVIVIGGIFFGMFIYRAIPFDYIILAIIAVYTVLTAFSLITLPVEFDASKRALVWLKSNRIIRNEEETKAKDALNWAAMTYVVAALASLATLLYYISLFMGGRGNSEE